MLVFLGGVDRPNLTLTALEAVLEATSLEVEIDVVVGGGNPHWETLKHACDGNDRVSLSRQVDDMARRMVEADVAIGAGGTTTWERCALGLPTLIVAVAENQEPIGHEAARYRVAQYLGHASDVTRETIVSSLRTLAEEPERLSRMSRAALELVDGRGVERVANCIMACQAEVAGV